MTNKSRPPQIHVTRAGIVFYLLQTAVIFGLAAWGYVKPESMMAKLTHHGWGVPLLIVVVTALGSLLAHLFHRMGFVLIHRSIPPAS